MNQLKRLRKIRIHREGTRILITTLIALLVVNIGVLYGFNHHITSVSLLVVSAIFYAIIINFFRCPIRRFDGDTEGIVVAPADGTVVVAEVVDEHEHYHDKRLMISIFMSLTNVHANWYPVDGVVTKVEHQSGNFYCAFLPKASTENERSMVVIETPDGQSVMARQIAGAMARRIVTYAEPREECLIDDHMGFIKFGSRVDVYLPLGTQLCVEVGQKTIGNQTVIAKLKTNG